MEKLSRMPEALGPLRDAAEDKNPEVAKRAGEALNALTRRMGAAKLKKLPAYAKARQVDRMVEALVMWREAISHDDRKAMRATAADIQAWAEKEFGPGVPHCKVPDLIVDNRGPGWPTRLTIGKKLAGWKFGDAIAESVDQREVNGGIVVKDGGLVVMDGPTFTNGDFMFAPPGLIPFAGLLVCNGDITLDQFAAADKAVLICTGNVRLDSGVLVRNTLIVTGAEITFGRMGEEYALKHGTILRPKEPKLAEFLKFYDAGAEGLHARVEGKNVFVTKVDAGKPFAAAGVRGGDRILKVNGTPVRDLRGLNRQLCRAEVSYPGTAALALARGETAVEAVVNLAE